MCVCRSFQQRTVFPGPWRAGWCLAPHTSVRRWQRHGSETFQESGRKKNTPRWRRRRWRRERRRLEADGNRRRRLLKWNRDTLDPKNSPKPGGEKGKIFVRPGQRPDSIIDFIYRPAGFFSLSGNFYFGTRSNAARSAWAIITGLFDLRKILTLLILFLMECSVILVITITKDQNMFRRY